MGLVAVKLETRGQRAAQPTQALDGLIPAPIPGHGKLPMPDDANLDLVSILQRERLNYGRGQRIARLLPHFETCILALAKSLDISNK